MAVARIIAWPKVKVKIVKFWHILIDLTAVFQQFSRLLSIAISIPPTSMPKSTPGMPKKIFRVSKQQAGNADKNILLCRIIKISLRFLR